MAANLGIPRIEGALGARGAAGITCGGDKSICLTEIHSWPFGLTRFVSPNDNADRRPSLRQLNHLPHRSSSLLLRGAQLMLLVPGMVG
jgi:hypothetical protein